VSDDPPLGRCPRWCEKPEGHDWEDEWQNGPVRYHTYRIEVTRYHKIGIDEVEQWTPEGRVRMREVILDVESPTSWDKMTAVAGFGALSGVMAVALADWPEGEVR
jgi:hypothetical protein